MSDWKPIKTNLVRNADSGKYYARVRVRGKLIWQSLGTTSRQVADEVLPRTLARIRAGSGAIHGFDITLGECSEIYLQRKAERGYRRRNQLGIEQAKSKPLKPRSLDYRRETVEGWRKLWGGFDQKPAAVVTDSDVQSAADSARKHYSATRFNGLVQTLRGILDIAVEMGALDKNPARNVHFAEVRISQKPIPSREQMTEILRLLDAHPRRKFAKLSVRAMAFTGLRPNEARHLQKADIDLNSGTLTARMTKNGIPRTIQMIPQAVELFRDEGVDKVLIALRKDPRRAIRTIGRLIGLEMTPYTMRHLHMSALIESGIDIATAAQIAGQQDRGVTLLRHYLHSRPEHLRKQLTKIVI